MIEAANGNVLVLGKDKSLRVAISLALCYECMHKNASHSALFICARESLQQEFPPTVHFTEDTQRITPAVLRRIQIKYVSDAFSLKRLFASLHMWSTIPHVIIIADMSNLIDPYHSIARSDNQFLETVGQVLGLANDFVMYCSRELQFSPKLIISEESRLPPLLRTLNMFQPQVWDVAPCPLASSRTKEEERVVLLHRYESSDLRTIESTQTVYVVVRKA